MHQNLETGCELRLPPWLGPFFAEAARQTFSTVEDRVGLAVLLARRNLEEGTGGPFGAAIFDRERHRLVAPGINLVQAAGTSLAHAEIVAMLLAQRRLGSFDLGAESLPSHELACSAEPCAMCLGAIGWSGVESVSFGARDEDVRAIGFDEGEKPLDWMVGLERRGIAVQAGVEREQARAVLEEYRRRGGMIYNGRGGR